MWDLDPQGKCNGPSKNAFFAKAWEFSIQKYYLSDKVFLRIRFYPRKLVNSRFALLFFSRLWMPGKQFLAKGDSGLYYCSTLDCSCSLGTVTQVWLVFQREMYLLLSMMSLVDYRLHRIQLQWKNPGQSYQTKMKYSRIQCLWVNLEASHLGECI